MRASRPRLRPQSAKSGSLIYTDEISKASEATPNVQFRFQLYASQLTGSPFRRSGGTGSLTPIILYARFADLAASFAFFSRGRMVCAGNRAWASVLRDSLASGRASTELNSC